MQIFFCCANFSIVFLPNIGGCLRGAPPCPACGGKPVLAASTDLLYQLNDVCMCVCVRTYVCMFIWSFLIITTVYSRLSTRQLGITIVHQCPSTSNKVHAKTFNSQSVYLCKCLYNVHFSCHGFKLELLHNIVQFCFFIVKYFSKVVFKHLGYCYQCPYYNGNYTCILGAAFSAGSPTDSRCPLYQRFCL